LQLLVLERFVGVLSKTVYCSIDKSLLILLAHKTQIRASKERSKQEKTVSHGAEIHDKNNTRTTTLEDKPLHQRTSNGDVN